MRTRSDRDGFALPMAIMVIGFITAGVLAAFTRTTAEVRVIDNQRVQTDAFALAQAGLERYMARGRVVPADTSITLTGGRARVRATLMRPAPTTADMALYLIRSDAVTDSGAAIPGGRRTVAQYAYRQIGTMQVLSAWTSLSGLAKNGAAGVVSGYDACTSAVLPGVALPDNTYTQNGTGDVVDGNPPILEMGTQAQMASQIKIDWPSIVDGSAPSVSADIIACYPGTYAYDANWSPCGTFPPSGAFTSDPNYWPTIVINGSAPLPSSGRGTLIVTGDLTFGGGDKWDGVILVGGMITDNGSGNIAGAVVTGLNVLRNMTVGQSSKLQGTKDYTYDSCAVANALSGMAKLIPIANAWVDNWAAW